MNHFFVLGTHAECEVKIVFYSFSIRCTKAVLNKEENERRLERVEFVTASTRIITSRHVFH